MVYSIEFFNDVGLSREAELGLQGVLSIFQITDTCFLWALK